MARNDTDHPSSFSQPGDNNITETIFRFPSSLVEDKKRNVLSLSLFHKRFFPFSYTHTLSGNFTSSAMLMVGKWG